ncbi:MAG: UDP-glucose 4-epimerase GalE [Candidatus Margulisbacteria bacterium]|nr:UDP-glucose 4-epimerase GalE [Candidatus Margulisiibacteriota bacterium]
MTKTILVAGGAGYIGSHIVRKLKIAGYHPVIFDNLSTGHKQSVKGEEFFWGDIRNPLDLDRVFTNYKIDAVMHFCARSLVGESMQKPEIYFENNIVGGFGLLQAMLKHQVKFIIFSSTAATYGEPESVPIDENAKQLPTNPYGESKLIFEKILHWYDKIHDIKHVNLRYFNAAGADDNGEIGEDHTPETHLIPNIFRVLNKQLDHLQVFGNDYSTADGTCVRDYIHIYDLAQAHILALKHILDGKGSDSFNLGCGKGYSINEIIKMVEKVTQKKVNYKMADRRPGDPAVLVASSEKIKKVLGWKEKYQLRDIIETAMQWHLNHPKGYAD